MTKRQPRRCRKSLGPSRHKKWQRRNLPQQKPSRLMIDDGFSWSVMEGGQFLRSWCCILIRVNFFCIYTYIYIYIHSFIFYTYIYYFTMWCFATFLFLPLGAMIQFDYKKICFKPVDMFSQFSSPLPYNNNHHLGVFPRSQPPFKKTGGSFGMMINLTPLKINMEHSHVWVWKLIFLSKWVICRFQPFICQGAF